MPPGGPTSDRLATLCSGIAELKASGVDVILVSSGAIAAGLTPLGLTGRPADIPSLQAAAAVGQGRLLARYARLLADHDQVAAQLLLTRYDFMHRQQYLNARNTLDRLLALGAVPIVNENDTVATDEIRFGDNDRLGALVANLARAKLLLLLTNAGGLHAADPRDHPDAPVIDEVVRITPELERMSGGRGSDLSTGGMASKIAAAWVATFSGVGVVVADGAAPRVLQRVATGETLGTYFHPHAKRVVGSEALDRVRTASQRHGRGGRGGTTCGGREKEVASSGRGERGARRVRRRGHGGCRDPGPACFREGVGTLFRGGARERTRSVDLRPGDERGHSP